MNHYGNVDRDAVLRAQVLLLGSGIGIHQEIAAYRTLAEISPLTYLARLARALLTFGQEQLAGRPEAQLAVALEAADVARRLAAVEPHRDQLLVDALREQGRLLEALGRPDEASAARRELAEVGRLGFAAGRLEGPTGDPRPFGRRGASGR
ncbi:hypothetical protein ACIRPK_04490 [Kitasatospora sp. NPDC101801]|uniref:hypothetical protein n=1 Tax=Kitasatospora sp. NPDC101801 TaxID=3364103 RepID=UPI00380B974A